MKNLRALLMGLALLLSGIGAFAEDEAPSFERLAGLQWEFSSGAGGWSTELKINPDGSFSGNFHDSEMGEVAGDYPNGTVYVCAFTGQMSGLEQMDGHTWRVQVDSVTPDEAPGHETIDDGIRYVTNEPYATKCRSTCPARRSKDLPRRCGCGRICPMRRTPPPRWRTGSSTAGRTIPALWAIPPLMTRPSPIPGRI